MEGIQFGEFAKLFGGGLLLRTRLAKGAPRAGGPDRYLLGRIACRGLDEPKCAGFKSRLQARHPRRLYGCGGEGRRQSKRPTRALETDGTVQWNDCAVDSFRFQRGDLVSGGVQCRTRQTISS